MILSNRVYCALYLYTRRVHARFIEFAAMEIGPVNGSYRKQLHSLSRHPHELPPHHNHHHHYSVHSSKLRSASFSFATHHFHPHNPSQFPPLSTHQSPAPTTNTTASWHPRNGLLSATRTSSSSSSRTSNPISKTSQKNGRGSSVSSLHCFFFSFERKSPH